MAQPLLLARHRTPARLPRPRPPPPLPPPLDRSLSFTASNAVAACYEFDRGFRRPSNFTLATAAADAPLLRQVRLLLMAFDGF